MVSLFIPCLEFWGKEEEMDSDIDTLRKYLLEKPLLSMKVVTFRLQSCACGLDRSQQLLMERYIWPEVSYFFPWIIFGFSEEFSFNLYFSSLGRNWNIWSWRQQMAFCLLSHVRQAGWYMSLTQWPLFWTSRSLNGLVAHSMIRCTQMMWTNFVSSFPLRKMPWQVWVNTDGKWIANSSFFFFLR